MIRTVVTFNRVFDTEVALTRGVVSGPKWHCATAATVTVSVISIVLKRRTVGMFYGKERVKQI